MTTEGFRSTSLHSRHKWLLTVHFKRRGCTTIIRAPLMLLNSDDKNTGISSYAYLVSTCLYMFSGSLPRRLWHTQSQPFPVCHLPGGTSLVRCVLCAVSILLGIRHPLGPLGHNASEHHTLKAGHCNAMPCHSLEKHGGERGVEQQRTALPCPALLCLWGTRIVQSPERCKAPFKMVDFHRLPGSHSLSGTTFFNGFIDC